MPRSFRPADSFKLTPEQESVVETPGSALIVAGPGTGKTRTAIEKALRATRDIEPNWPKQILFLSFSNAAVYRLAEAAKLHIPAVSRRQLRFTTYHALAAEILRRYGRFVGLPARVRVVDRLEETLLALDEGWPDEDEAHEAKLFEVARERGLLGFSVLIPLATRLLVASPDLARILGRRFPLVVVDEFQDTSQLQWELLKALSGAAQVVAFGDPNQIIYGNLHAATERRMEEFKEWKGVEASRFSPTNFRCGSANILQFAEALLTGNPFAAAGQTGLAVRDVGYRNRLRSYLALFWKSVRDRVGKDQTIAFLAPSNPIAEEIAIGLRAPPADAQVSFPVHTRLARDDAAHDAVMLALVALRDHAISGGDQKLRAAAVALSAMDLAWNNRKKRKSERVLAVANILREEIGRDSALRSVVEVARTTRDLEALVPSFVDAIAPQREFQTTCKRIKAYDRLTLPSFSPMRSPQLSLFEHLRSTREPKGLLGYSADPGTTHVLNYHRAKGREFDFVAMVVDPRGESGRTALDEMRRLYYVCATRAKRGLQVFYYGREVGRVLGPVIRPANR